MSAGFSFSPLSLRSNGYVLSSMCLILALLLFSGRGAATQPPDSTVKAGDVLDHLFTLHDISAGFGCQCFTEESLNSSEVDCKCSGKKITEIPTDLIPHPTLLKLTDTSIQNISNSSLQNYSSSLKDLFIVNAPRLMTIETGAFRNLKKLRILKIQNAPLLKSIPDDSFSLYLPSLRFIVIINCGLEEIPNLKELVTDKILELDFDKNKLTKLRTEFIKVNASRLLLQDNLIEEVEARAFFGSQIGKVSLRGNRNLVRLHQDAFLGLQSLTELDLSETSIERLPTVGLETLEKLNLEKTESLRVFPSIYQFRSIIEAKLTYPYHCCAFRFPATHDPAKHAEYQTRLLSEHCTETEESPTTPSTLSERMTTTPPPPMHRRRRRRRKRRGSLAVAHDDSRWSSVVAGGGFGSFGAHSDINVHPTFSSVMGGFVQPVVVHPNNASHHFFPDPSINSDVRVRTGGFHTEIKKQDHVSKPQEDGTFHTAVTPSKSQNAFCGTIVKNYRDVHCSPAPDAFNPCEDVMGNLALRIAVWFVVVAAVLGNLAVMVVLMSSRFKMTVSKFLMCNLACADFCMGLYLLLVAAMDLHTMGEYFNHAISWQHGLGCQVAGFLTVFASELSIFTLTVITLERWYAITYAIHLNKRLKLGMAAKIMVGGWVYALTLATLPLLGISGFANTSICLPMENRDSIDVAYLIALLTINGLAFLLICGCYGKMYLSISGHNSTVTQNDMTVAKRMAMLVFTDFACWAPIAFFGLTAVAGYPLINVTNSKILLVFFYPLNSCANPFLYAILTKQYRRDLFVMLSRYGLCTTRANKYKPTYSNNTNQRTTVSTGAGTNHRGSVLIHLSSGDSVGGKAKMPLTKDSTDDTPKSTPPTPLKGTSMDSGSRRLSIVPETSHTSEEELTHDKTSSPLHKGSPHPIKNNHTKLNATLEQEQMLQRMMNYECSLNSPRPSENDSEIIPLTETEGDTGDSLRGLALDSSV